MPSHNSPTPYLALRRMSSPEAEMISLAEAKLYLRVDHADEDIFISEMILAVRQFAEDYLGRSLVSQRWQVDYESVDTILHLPMAPIQEIIDITMNGTLLNAQDYQLIAQCSVTLSSPITGQITVTFDGGTDDLNQPYAVKQAMLAHIALCYDQRGMDIMQPAPAHRLYTPYKEVRI